MKIYSEQEAITESIKYFDGDVLAATTWVNKYAMRNESGELLESNPKMMHDRIINEILRIESEYPDSKLTREELEEYFYGFKYLIPGGSSMSGIGNKYKHTSLSNCFVIEPPCDSYGGIFKADQELVQLMKRRGGVGTDLSNLRPAGSRVTNDAKTSSGMVSFMERYSNSTRETAQNGRRGALMLSVSVNHPDVDQFMDAKLQAGKVTGANISVKLTDEFMKAVKDKSTFIQRFPIDTPLEDLFDDNKSGVSPQLDVLYEGVKKGTYYKIIDAHKLWMKLIHNAWASAEPGILFEDNILRESPADFYEGFQTVSTNPCFSGDTLVAVADGRNAVSIKQLAEEGKEFPVYCAWPNESHGDKNNPWVTYSSKATAFKTGTKKLLKLTLSDGSTFRCTEDHQLALDSGEYIKAKDSLGLTLAKFFTLFKSVGYGTKYRFINSISCYKQYQYVANYYGLEADKDEVIHHIDGDSSNDRIDNLKVINYSDHQSNHMKQNNPVHKMNQELFSLLNKRKSIQSAAKRYNWDEEYKNSKLNEFDSLYGNRIEELRSQSNKIEEYPGVDTTYSVSVISIEEDGIEDVYDLNVPTYHNFYIITKSYDDKYLNCSGVLVHNCGEIPLTPYDSCRLMAINLYSFVDNPFTESASFNIEKFTKVAYDALIIMDDLVTLEVSHIDDIISKIKSDPESDEVKQVELNLWKKIKDKTLRGRRTGIGITAEGDMLAALGIQYGSNESMDFSTSIHKYLALAVYESSIDLAEKRGAFTAWNKEEINFFDMYVKHSIFLQRLYNELTDTYRNKWEKTGRRNISCLTIAPTGTISLMTQTTSGIEPLFKAWYIRRRKTSDKSKAVFTDKVGDMFEEFKVFHPKFVEWYRRGYNEDNLMYSTEQCINILSNLPEENLDDIYRKSPWYKSTAQDIDWVCKVKLQGSIQEWVDHSISCTTNVPKDTSVETCSKIYMTAYLCGCKGETIYRDGSRDGVLITEPTSTPVKHKEIKVRPDELKAQIIRFKNGKENWIAFIGLLDGNPYELFSGVVQDDIRYLPKSITSGWIVRVATGPEVNGKVPHRYDFKYDIGYGYQNVLPAINMIFNSETWNYGRFISGMLRAGVPVAQVVNVLNSLNSDMGESINTWKRGIARALQKYISDGVKSEDKCPECGSNLVYEGGCKHCPNCGYSKCE